MQDLNVLFQICGVFLDRSKKQDCLSGLWLAETFTTSPLKPHNGFQRNLTGSEILTSQVHDMWPIRCRIEFWPHWISTRGVLIQRAVLRIQRIFHVELRPQRQGVIELRPLRRIKFGPPVELWPRVLIPRWIMTLGINSTLNFDPESWFNVKLWPGIGITI